MIAITCSIIPCTSNYCDWILSNLKNFIPLQIIHLYLMSLLLENEQTWEKIMGEYIMKEADVIPPPKIAIVQMLKEGLEENFAEVSVEWVDCPDLTKEPFNLAAPGLCGNPALMQVGGFGNVYSIQQVRKVYNIKHLLNRFGYNEKSLEKTLVIGAGICEHPTTALNCDLYMNTLYSLNAGKVTPVLNKSQVLLCLTESTYKAEPYAITDDFHECCMYGNFFISEGKPGQVVKVHVKKRIGSLDFISAMQSSFRYQTSEYMIDFGGTFVVNNGKVWHHLMPCTSPRLLQNTESIHRWLRYHRMCTPLTAVGTFSNRTRHFLGNAMSGYEVLNITKQHFHTFSSIHNIGGHYYIDELEENVATEYLGYFCPTKKLYCVDPINVNVEVPEFNLKRLSYGRQIQQM